MKADNGWLMFIQVMTETECLNILARSRLGRLGCARENQPYVVPIYFVYEKPYLYGFTTPGQKVEWMRSNPLVCVEVDEIVDDTHWLSIILFGSYEELSDTQDRHSEHGQQRLHAHNLLQHHAEWWEPGSASGTYRNPMQSLVPVFYRIRIDRITGRRVTPSPGEPIVPSTPPWLGRVLLSFLKPLTGRRK